MNWKDVTKAPTQTMLRQFAGLSLVVFGGMAAWRLWHGQQDAWTVVFGTLAVLIGVVGLILPAAVRYVFTGWMILAFPIGWVVSRVVLGAMFYLLFTLVALVFRTIGRDALQLKRKPPSAESYWEDVASGDARSYFRQF